MSPRIPTVPSSAEALLELANVLVDQAKQLLGAGWLRCRTSRRMPSSATSFSSEARQLLEDAQPKFRQAEQFYTAALEQHAEDARSQDAERPDRPAAGISRPAGAGERARGQADFEAASTYPADSDEFVKQNEATAKKLAELYEKYSRWLVGFYARLYEGRCYQAVGDYQRALGCYEELISQSSVHPAFRKLIASAYGYQAQCLIAQGKLGRGDRQSDRRGLSAAQDDEAEIAGMAVRAIRTGRGAADQGRVGGHEAERATRTDGGGARGVSRGRGGAERLSGRRLVRRRPRWDRASGPIATRSRDFAAAYQAGKDAMASVNAAKHGDAVGGEEQSRRDSRTAAAGGPEQAAKPVSIFAWRCRWWMMTRTSSSSTKFAISCAGSIGRAGDYYQAAVLGDFLARRYPDHPAAAASAKLALASYERLQQPAAQAGGKPQDTEFEARKMAEIAEFMTRRWPDTPAAETANRVLVSYAIRSDRIDEAKDLLDQGLGGGAAGARSAAGQCAVGTLSCSSRRERELTSRLTPSSTSLRGDAIQFMQSGFDAARKSGQVTEVSATSGLYLVQALAERGASTRKRSSCSKIRRSGR